MFDLVIGNIFRIHLAEDGFYSPHVFIVVGIMVVMIVINEILTTPVEPGGFFPGFASLIR